MGSSGVGPLLVPVSLDPLQLTERGMVMKLGMDRTVDDPDLQAGVSVTKGYRGFHHIRAVLRPSIDNRLSVLMSFVTFQPQRLPVQSDRTAPLRSGITLR
jgi:hypothetical protein